MAGALNELGSHREHRRHHYRLDSWDEEEEVSENGSQMKQTIDDPPPLGEEYYKSRKQLALFSGMLFAWEFIGVQLTTQPVTIFEITFQSPEVAPYVLIALIVYFLTRVVIEWLQSPQARRIMPISQIDFGLTILIALFALSAFGIQRLFEIRLAKFASVGTLMAAVIGILVAILLLYAMEMRRELRTNRNVGVGLVLLLGIIVLFITPTIGLLSFGRFLGFSIGTLVLTLACWWVVLHPVSGQVRPKVAVFIDFLSLRLLGR